MSRSTRRMGSVLTLVALTWAVTLVQAAPTFAAPTFKPPFECGQKYVGTTNSLHNGQPAIDFNQSSNADAGDEVLASAPGKILPIVTSNGQVTIDHGSGWRTTYAHMTGIAVTSGETVVTGELLGFIGEVGRASGEHLHYQQEYGSSVVQARFNGVLYSYGTTLTSTLCLTPPVTDSFDSNFWNDIKWLYTSGLTSGCDTIRYCPEGDVTRGQMATFLDRFLDLPATSRDYFTDDETSMHEGAINRIAAAGITSGCSATRFCPDGLLTRGQMASFLDRALDLPSTSTDFFTDDEDSSHEGAINRVAAAGITSGCSATRFCPDGIVLRQQMAAFLHRADNWMN